MTAIGSRAEKRRGHVPVGTLIVDLVDTKEACLVWQGRAADTISSDSQARERQLREAVARMFEGFPPRPGAG